jgi:hypothetical protein
MKCGSYTTPQSNDLPNSGPSGKPANCEPEMMPVLCRPEATSLLTKLPSVGTFAHAGFGGLPV